MACFSPLSHIDLHSKANNFILRCAHFVHLLRVNYHFVHPEQVPQRGTRRRVCINSFLTWLPVLCSIFFSLGLISCASYDSLEYQKELGVRLVDTLATKETVLLFRNLKSVSEKKIIFGHQNSTQYGVYWRGDPDHSDVKDVTGSFPGVYGWDFESIPRYDSTKALDRIPLLVKDAYERGGINTFSWHHRNPVTGNAYSDTTIAVKYILPGGSYHENYLRVLDSVAEYSSTLVDDEGAPIPIIFRPYHELDGHWFWWGRPFCTPEEFVALWRMTVDYLRSVKGVKNYLYAFSTDRWFDTEEEYLERYPGDNYVDIVGMDNYHDFTPKGDSVVFVTKKLRIISSIAEKKNKIAAFTETGSILIPDSTWWTNQLYKAMDDDSIKIAYVMVWRNTDPGQFYAPYPGQSSAENFVEFRHKQRMLFQDDFPNLYKSVLMDRLVLKAAHQQSAGVHQ
jgi:mannan endo-1,4-beta-mannosidase